MNFAPLDLARIQRAWAAANLTPSPPSPAVDAPRTTGTDGAPGDTAGVAPLGGGDSPTFEAWDDERNAVLLEGVPGPLFADPACIKVWRFCEAPELFQQLSGHGGDEDWIALVPPDFGWVGWLDSGGSFGCCDVSEHALPNGWTVHIGAHS